MTINSETFEEIRKYMDLRAESWRMEANEAAQNKVTEQLNTHHDRQTKRIQFFSALGGVTFLAIATALFTYVGNTATTTANDAVEEYIKENKNLADYQAESLNQIVNARAALAASLSLAKKTATEAESTSTELYSIIQSSRLSVKDVNSEINRMKSISDQIDIEIANLRTTLTDAKKTQSDLSKLDGNVEKLTNLSDTLLGASGNITELVKATLKDESIRNDIVNAATFPSGAVVAFTSQNFGDAICPKGWEFFQPSANRFIIGASEKYLPGSTGGKEFVTLTISQMPSHSHSGTVGTDGYKAGMLNEPAYHNGQAQPIGLSGGGQPHNNMPPFFALYHCLKSDN